MGRSHAWVPRGQACASRRGPPTGVSIARSSRASHRPRAAPDCVRRPSCRPPSSLPRMVSPCRERQRKRAPGLEGRCQEKRSGEAATANPRTRGPADPRTVLRHSFPGPIPNVFIFL
jgi:hypothetical protein